MPARLGLLIAGCALGASLSCKATWPTQPTAPGVTDWTPPSPVTSVQLFYPGPLDFVAVGSTFGFGLFAVHADGVYAPPGDVVWTSSDSAVVRILGRSLQAIGPGVAEIVGWHGGFRDSATVTVMSEVPYPALIIQPPAAPRELDRAETARALYTVERGSRGEDVTALASWESSNPAVARVEAGRVTAVGQGRTRITARYNGLTGGYVFSVTDAVDDAGVDIEIPLGPYAAGTTVTWSQNAFLTLASARTGTFYFALVDQHDRVLSPLPWNSALIGKPGGRASFTNTITLPAGTSRVCSQIMLVTDAGVRRTFRGSCKEVR